MSRYQLYGELVVIPELMPETTSAVDPYTGVGTLPREYRQATGLFARGTALVDGALGEPGGVPGT